MSHRFRGLPEHPDFPHGMKTGYFDGCRKGSPCPATPSCFEQYQTYDAELRRKVREGIPRQYKVPPVRAYIQSFLDQGWTRIAVANAANVCDDSITRIMRRRSKTVKAAVAHRLMAVDEEALLENATGYVPVRLVRWKLGSLLTLRWSCAALAEQLGYHNDYIVDIVSGKVRGVLREVVDDVDALFERLRNVPFAGHQSYLTRRLVERYDFRHPDDYGPDGIPWDAEERDEAREARWARRDMNAYLRMQVLHLTLNVGLTGGQIMGHHTLEGVDERSLQRIRNDTGLKWTGGHISVLEDDQDARIAECREVLGRWTEAGELADPFPFVKELGMMTATLWSSLDKSDKPELKAA